jgi:two-component system LytT family sensor kinase
VTTVLRGCRGLWRRRLCCDPAPIPTGEIEALRDEAGARRCCASIGLIFAAWTTLAGSAIQSVCQLFGARPFAHLWLNKFYSGILSSLILYAVILAVSYVSDSRVRLAFQQTETAQLNEQLSKAQLNALGQQIEPHFLFNTLNAVAVLVSEGRNDVAVSMIAGLSDFLRRVGRLLQNSDQ